jgi:hypothetical protein
VTRFIKQNKIVKFALILLLGVASFLLVSCRGNGISVNPTNGKLLYDDGSGGVQTNDLETLQNIVPYHIVIPDYLPEEVRTSPVMYIKSVGMNSKNDVDVQFSYWNSPKSVQIEEDNYSSNHVLDTQNGESIQMIDGIEVLQIPLQNFVAGVKVEVNSFLWNKNGVSYSVDVWDYSVDEGLKIVESMIK